MSSLSLLAACNQPPSAEDNSEDQLRAASARYDRALINGDAAALNRHYTDDFQRIGNDGAVHDKTSQVQLMTEEVDLLNGRSDEVKVLMLGPDSAVVTGRFAGRYRYDGNEENFTERYTNVWVRKDGQWRVRHEHASLVPSPETPNAS
jgi:ketosteroid isomerase-like protein